MTKPTPGICPHCGGHRDHLKRACDACRLKRRRAAKRRANQRQSQKTKARKSSPLAGPRICLKCDVSFMSEGPYNRICPTCSHRAGRRQPAVHRAEVPRSEFRFINADIHEHWEELS